jgi:hypothetical protein
MLNQNRKRKASNRTAIQIKKFTVKGNIPPPAAEERRYLIHASCSGYAKSKQSGKLQLR